MKKLFVAFAILLLTSTFNQTLAQDRWSLELRPGINYAVKDISDADLKLGFGGELTAAYRFLPHLSGYVGWSYNNFAVEQSFAGPDASFEETGYTFGLQFIHPLGELNIDFLIRLGGTYNHIEIENNDGEIIIDSGNGLGWQAEAGIVIPISNKFELLPSVRYRSLSRDITIENMSTPVQLDYISIGLGLRWLF